MTPQTTSVDLPYRRYRTVIVIQVLWSVLILALAGWWGSLLHSQAKKIQILDPSTAVEWAKTERMIVWEGGFFLFALLITSMALIWSYWREAQRSRAMHAFFASMTHELKTPLASIRLQAESASDALSRVENLKSVDHFIARLLTDASRLESQVEKTLELARVEGGGRVYREAFSLRSALERAKEQALESYPGLIEIRFEGKLDHQAIGDSVAFNTVLRNLIENSVRHGSRAPVTVIFRVDAEGAQVRIEYVDDGKGSELPRSELGRLFARGSASHGTGIGLYLSRELMRRMGGDASFASDSGFRAMLTLGK